MKTMLALLVSFSSFVALSTHVQAQSPSMSATLTESGGFVTLSITITGTGTECPGGWQAYFMVCGDPTVLPIPGMLWIGNQGRALAIYEPSIRGACIVIAVYCPSTGAILTTTVTYP